MDASFAGTKPRRPDLLFVSLKSDTASTTSVTQHWVKKAPSLSNERWLKRALGAAQKRDRSKEVLVETAAQERMISIAEPRIAAAEQAGNSAEATRLRGLLEDAKDESNAYISYWNGKAGN